MPPKFSHQYNQSPNFISTKKALLWWDVNTASYHLKAPFSEELINLLKRSIPTDHRSWNPLTKEWIFEESYFEPMKFLCEKLWPSSKFITREEAEEELHERPISSSKTNGSKASLDSKFFELTGEAIINDNYNATRKLYLKAIMQLHPDRQGGDSAKAAELNVVWSQIEKTVFGK